MEETVKIFKALSDKTRLRILNLLIARDCCVCEVMEALDISQTRASRNLQILHEAGLLRHRKEGLWSHYGINQEGADVDAGLVIDLVRSALEHDPQAAEDISKLAAVMPVECGTSCAAKASGSAGK